MKQRTKGISLTIIGIIVAAIGVVAPISWDWWKSRCDLTLTRIQTANLVEKKADIKGLQITYMGNVVENLSKTTFSLQNTGRTPITRGDLVTPPRVDLQSGNVLSFAVEQTRPRNIEASLKPMDHGLQLSFDLLNPGDSITFSLLVDSNFPVYVTSARVKNLSELTYNTSEKQISVRRSVGWTVYVVGFFALFFVAVGVSMLLEIPRKRKQLRAIKNGQTPIHPNESMRVVQRYIQVDLKFLTGARRAGVLSALPAGSDVLTEAQAKTLLDVIESKIIEEPSLGGALFAFVFAAAGIWYCSSNIFS